MKKLLLILGLLILPVPALAVQITVPSAPAAYYGLSSTSTGQWLASSTPTWLGATINALNGVSLNGFGLTTCNSSNQALTWDLGAFGCHTISGGSGGSGGGTWATTTSSVPNQYINYPLNNTDIVTVGNNATTSAPVWFDPNTLFAKIFSFFTDGLNGSTTLQKFTATNGTTTNLNISNSLGGKLTIDNSVVSTSTMVCANNCQYTTIQSALNAGEKNIQLKAETYTGLVYIANTRIKITGAGFNTVIQCNGNTNAVCVSATSTSQEIIKDLKILNSSATVGGYGLDISNSANVYVQDVRIEGFATSTKVVDSADSTFYNTFRDVISFDSKSGFEFGGSQANNNLLDGVRIRPKAGYGGYGVYLGDARGITLHQVDEECPAGESTGTTTGLYVDGTSREILVENNWMEACGTGLKIESGANRVTIVSSSITSNGTDISDSGTQTVFLNTSKTGTTINNIASSTASNFIATNATSTTLNVSNIFSLGSDYLTDITGSGLSITGGALGLTSNTISGVALGSNLNNFSVSSDFTGTSYNGSAAVSDWVLKMSQPHNWTGLQTFTNASSTLFSSTIASTSQLMLSGKKDAILTVDANGWVVASSTIGNNQLQNSTISGVSLGSNLAALTAGNTLTSAGTFNGSVARTFDIDLTHANIWTALQTFSNASSTLFSSTIASTSQLYLSGFSDGCLNVASGKVGSTGIACGSGGGGGNSKWASSTFSTLLIFPNAGSSTDVLLGGTASVTPAKLEIWATSANSDALFIGNGSTTLQNFTATNSTTTGATTTNFAITASGLASKIPFIGADGDVTAASISTGLSLSNAGVLTATLGTTIAPNELVGQPIGNNQIVSVNGDGTRFQATGTTALTAGSFNASTTVVNNLPIINSTNATTSFAYWTNALASGSSTFQAFTATQGTITSATSTNLYWTNALASGSTTLQAFTATQGTITSSTSTNDTALHYLATGSSTFQALFSPSATGTNLYATNFLALGSSTLGLFTSPQGTIVSATSTNLYTTNFLATASSTFQALFSTSATGTNLYAGNFLASGSSTFQALGATSATATNLYGGNILASASTTLQSVFATNSTTTNATTSKFAIYNNDSSPMWVLRNFGSYLSWSTTTPVNDPYGGATTSVDALQLAATGTPSIAVGTSTPSGTAFFTYTGSQFGDALVVAGATNTPFRVTTNGAIFGAKISNTNTGDYICFNTSTGEWTQSATACSLSSIRWKQNVRNLDLGLAEVLKLRPVLYDLKPQYGTDKNQPGFIAEEAVKVVPNLVSIGTDGKVSGFDYPKLTAVLTKAIQELNSKVDVISGAKRKAEENWQWIAMGLMLLWIVRLEIKTRK